MVTILVTREQIGRLKRRQVVPIVVVLGIKWKTAQGRFMVPLLLKISYVWPLGILKRLVGYLFLDMHVLLESRQSKRKNLRISFSAVLMSSLLRS